MRILGNGITNELKLTDNLSGSKLSLFYRMPTTEEINGYSNGMLVRRGNQMKRAVGEMRQKYGARIMTAIGEGSFGKLVDGKPLPISSDPKGKHFDPEWKALVIKQAPDVIELLAVQVFEASVSKDVDGEDQTDDSIEDDIVGE